MQHITSEPFFFRHSNNFEIMFLGLGFWVHKLYGFDVVYYKHYQWTVLKKIKIGNMFSVVAFIV